MKVSFRTLRDNVFTSRCWNARKASSLMQGGSKPVFGTAPGSPGGRGLQSALSDSEQGRSLRAETARPEAAASTAADLRSSSTG